MIRPLSILSSLFFLVHLPAMAVSEKSNRVVTEYTLKWRSGNLPISVELAQGPLTMISKVARNGVFAKDQTLPIIKNIPDGKLTMAQDEVRILYLFIKNNGKKKLRFSVAPHSTEPGASALGFNFNCLCNGHIYEVPAGQTWYRIMSLDNRPMQTTPAVELVHDIYEVKK